MNEKKIIVIAGPTASGKSKLAMKLAESINAEIVSADSMQIYRYMDIGTAKPDKVERLRVAHHMIDVVDPDEPFSAARYRKEAAEAIDDIIARGGIPIICGGTGLYIRVLTRGIFEGPAEDPGYREELSALAKKKGTPLLHERLREVDPQSAEKIHPNNRARLIRALEVFKSTGRPLSAFHAEHAFSESPYDALKLYIERPRRALYERINQRSGQMITRGLLEETEALLKRGYREDLKPMRSLGYKEMAGVLNGTWSMEEATELLKKNTRNYAKRQVTWFKKEPGFLWQQIDGEKEPDKIKELIKGHLE
ncbi:MAG: tRNA (adenosine(37)-N6)-dimethylallyltransferase MiaA [Thermodesulfobacteriota bacterium]